MREDEDEYNIILKFENEKNGLIVITYYAAPGEDIQIESKNL